jgi:hypothetical protein
MALVLLFAYGLVRIAIMGFSLNNTYNELRGVQSSATSENLDSSILALDAAVNASSAAASGADDPIVQAFNYLPIVGQDLSALGSVSRHGHKVLQALQQVVSYTNTIKQLKGALNPTVIGTLRNSVVALNGAVQSANIELSKIKSPDLHFGLSEKMATAQKLMAKTAVAMATATPMVQVGAEIVSSQAEQRWFIATQNLAESRAQGGIIGAYAVITVADGKVSLEKFGSDNELLAMGPINFKSYPDELRDIWGVDLTDWRDLNASAHAPYAAQLIYDGWKQKTGQVLDGVVFVGQGTVSHMTAAAGEFSVRGNKLKV